MIYYCYIDELPITTEEMDGYIHKKLSEIIKDPQVYTSLSLTIKDKTLFQCAPLFNLMPATLPNVQKLLQNLGPSLFGAPIQQAQLVLPDDMPSEIVESINASLIQSIKEQNVGYGAESSSSSSSSTNHPVNYPLSAQSMFAPKSNEKEKDPLALEKGKKKLRVSSKERIEYGKQLRLQISQTNFPAECVTKVTKLSEEATKLESIILALSGSITTVPASHKQQIIELLKQANKSTQVIKHETTQLNKAASNFNTSLQEEPTQDENASPLTQP